MSVSHSPPGGVVCQFHMYANVTCMPISHVFQFHMLVSHTFLACFTYVPYYTRALYSFRLPQGVTAYVAFSPIHDAGLLVKNESTRRASLLPDMRISKYRGETRTLTPGQVVNSDKVLDITSLCTHDPVHCVVGTENAQLCAGAPELGLGQFSNSCQGTGQAANGKYICTHEEQWVVVSTEIILEPGEIVEILCNYNPHVRRWRYQVDVPGSKGCMVADM